MECYKAPLAIFMSPLEGAAITMNLTLSLAGKGIPKEISFPQELSLVPRGDFCSPQSPLLAAQPLAMAWWCRFWPYATALSYRHSCWGLLTGPDGLALEPLGPRSQLSDWIHRHGWQGHFQGPLGFGQTSRGLAPQVREPLPLCGSAAFSPLQIQGL